MATDKPPADASAEDLVRQARSIWAEAIDLGLYDDPASIRRVAGILQRAVKADPAHVPALTLLADLLAALTAYAEADEFARRAAEAEPGAAGATRLRELLAIPNGRDKRAAIMSHLSAKWNGSAW